MQGLIEKPVGRWAIHIDLEGFGHLYGKEDFIFLSLGELMKGIFQIGTQYYPDSPDRIFAHQLGDGFIIVSDFPGKTFERPVAIALSLLRHVASSGRYANILRPFVFSPYYHKTRNSGNTIQLILRDFSI